jgi:fructokinase
VRIGVDLGGTKIAAVALDDCGSAVAMRRSATPAGDYRSTVDAVGAVVEDIECELGSRCSVGIGTPGSRSRRTGLQQKDGAGAVAGVVFGVILGSGVGGGLVVRGRIVEGRNGIAGEWGHNPLPWPSLDDLPGPPCYCGKRGCIETFLSGPGLARAFERRTGRVASAAEVAAGAAAGEADARATLSEYRERLARGLAHIVNLVDPDLIVLGGGLSNVAALYEGLPRLMARYVFCSEDGSVQVVPPLHGDASGVRGAAWLWPAGSTG